VVAVVVAAGRAERFGGAVPKQFLDLGGRSVLVRAVEAMASCPGVDGVVAVLPAEELDGPRAAEIRGLPAVLAVTAGGESRAESVRRGIEAAGPTRNVLVHDAARPLVSRALIEAVLGATLEHGAALPVLPVADTVKEEDGAGAVARTLDRSRLRLAQTPQGARTEWLLQALAAAARDGVEVTDEAAALERAGLRVALVPGDPGNLKITSLEDLEEARRRLGGGRMDLRVGIGFDIHRFGAQRRLVLGGVEFPAEPGLEGHSDADVVLHAAMDAVLGAAGLGDIGVHFPPGDPRFAGADSRRLAAEVSRLAQAEGYTIVNLDLSLLAERPKVSSRAAEMKSAVAEAFGVGADRVGLKATTLEGLGALGRGEGIACQAVALLRREEGR
jgi:2-C-methyl-D-erythritol 4-phosphate cytidylyltransferase / 2-C-methyl-D-erythritol 2,4-cyclodiphosphate synthase